MTDTPTDEELITLLNKAHERGVDGCGYWMTLDHEDAQHIINRLEAKIKECEALKRAHGRQEIRHLRSEEKKRGKITHLTQRVESAKEIFKFWPEVNNLIEEERFDTMIDNWFGEKESGVTG